MLKVPLDKLLLSLVVALASCVPGSRVFADDGLITTPAAVEPAEDAPLLFAGSSEDGDAESPDAATCEDCAECKRCKEPSVVSRKPLFDCSHLDALTKLGSKIDNGCNFKMPITGGAWHWFHQSLIGRSGGYGIPTIRDTYFYYLYADPEYKLSDANKVGGHVELRLRETDTFRSFVDDQIWTWEAYGYVHNEKLGTLKAGQLYNRFGIFWDGVFFGNAPYFDGLKLDADYGLSWEKTTKVHDCLSVDSYAQFFFAEDQSNGSFGGADAESVAGYTEHNTGVGRIVPTWTLRDGAQLAVGFSAMVGAIESKIALPDETVWAYGMDATYTKGRWKAFIDASQTHGVRNPVNYVSGGPSDELTNVLAGVHYTRGPVTLRSSYSSSIYGNPNAVQNMFLTGATITLTKHVDLYVEWVHQRVDYASLPGRDGYFFNSLEWVINWHF